MWVLADSLVRSLRRPDARRAVVPRRRPSRARPIGPDTPYADRATPGGRDRLVYGLASVTLVVGLRPRAGRRLVGRGRGDRQGLRAGGGVARPGGRAGQRRCSRPGERRGSSRSRSSTRCSTAGTGQPVRRRPGVQFVGLPTLTTNGRQSANTAGQGGHVVLHHRRHVELVDPHQQPLAEGVGPQPHHHSVGRRPGGRPAPPARPRTRAGGGRRGSRCGPAAAMPPGR